jgi:hypothetical protein
VASLTLIAPVSHAMLLRHVAAIQSHQWVNGNGE